MSDTSSLSKETRQRLESVAEQLEAEKERQEREKRRAETKYGGLIEDE